jgi:hypothetical protein
VKKLSSTPSDERVEQWIAEYEEFNNAEPVEPPKHLTETIIGVVHQALNPTVWSVFLKLTLIHAIAGTATLAFCPQFGFGLISGMGLMGPFMAFGEQGCMVGCGAVFMSGSLLTASLILKSEEVRAIRRTRLLQISLLALLSIGIFICSGAGIVVSLAAFWLIGSILGGLITLELGWRIRERLIQRI